MKKILSFDHSEAVAAAAPEESSGEVGVTFNSLEELVFSGAKIPKIIAMQYIEEVLQNPGSNAKSLTKAKELCVNFKLTRYEALLARRIS